MSAQVVQRLAWNCTLGEGLHWDGRRGRLWAVDIHGRRILAWDLDQPGWQEWSTPQRVGWVIAEPNTSTLLAGYQQGFARVRLLEDGQTSHEWLARPFGDRGDLRLNDAKQDSTGAIWAGSLNNDDEQREDGQLFRFGPEGTLSVQDGGYRVCNGPAISLDERWMLHTDSARRTIYAFDLDVTRGAVSNRRVWKQFSDAQGFPDGMAFDPHGRVWVAHWGAGCVSCFHPDGALLRCIEIPAPLVTNVCFAGARHERLFVSTAHVGMGPQEVARWPGAGQLHEVLDWE